MCPFPLLEESSCEKFWEEGSPSYENGFPFTANNYKHCCRTMGWVWTSLVATTGPISSFLVKPTAKSFTIKRLSFWQIWYPKPSMNALSRPKISMVGARLAEYIDSSHTQMHLVRIFIHVWPIEWPFDNSTIIIVIEAELEIEYHYPEESIYENLIEMV